QSRWPGHDHNTVGELCRCCALRLVQSGSKWSVWLCRPCLGMVKNLNDQSGRCVFPIGRHSLMNGVGYRAGPVPNPVALGAFADQFDAFIRATRGTEGWRQRMVVSHALEAELPGHGRVPLPRYLSRTAAADLWPEQAFRALCRAADADLEP
ncbi:MAG: hypothetical protein ACRDYV_17905, partial [Acidimicrobiia bacterium]